MEPVLLRLKAKDSVIPIRFLCLWAFEFPVLEKECGTIDGEEKFLRRKSPLKYHLSCLFMSRTSSRQCQGQAIANLTIAIFNIQYGSDKLCDPIEDAEPGQGINSWVADVGCRTRQTHFPASMSIHQSNIMVCFDLCAKANTTKSLLCEVRRIIGRMWLLKTYCAILTLISVSVGSLVWSRVSQ